MKNIIALAPMDGITNNAYRTICMEIRNNPKNALNTSYEFYRFTEFMSSEGYTRNPRKLTRHLLTTQGSNHTVAQIYGGDHERLLQTAIEIDTKYSNDFCGIELNIGCPSPKIMSCEAGSGMLRCRPKTLQIIQQISSSIQKPFSIKTRTGLTFDDQEEQKRFILDAAPYCKMITIHGRNYKQSHSGSVDRLFIQDIKKECIALGYDCTIIGNGGLKSAVDSLQYLESLDGIMLGQAAMCNPRSLVNYTPDVQELYDTSIKHLHYNLANERYFEQESTYDNIKNILRQPTTTEIDEIVQGLINNSIHSPNEKRFSLIEFRKHLFWYITGLRNNNEFKREAAHMTNYSELLQLIHTYFTTLLTSTGE